MSKKITAEEFLRRFKISFPDENIEVVEYTAMSNPATVKCLKCGKIHTKTVARQFLANYNCCEEQKKTKYEKVQKILEELEDFELIKKFDKDFVIVRHNTCGNEYKRSLQSILMSPSACTYCETHKKKNMLSIEEVQADLTEQFHGEIQILDYKGQLEKNHYKCLKCGLIFTRDNISMKASRGCPKCDKNKSRGEVEMARYLEDKNLIYKEQVGVPELYLQHFDFGVYNDKEELVCYIEVNGEQHYQEREVFRDGLQKIQERDERKRQYCKERNIPLYEIRWFKGTFKNLDILPF